MARADGEDLQPPSGVVRADCAIDSAAITGMRL